MPTCGECGHNMKPHCMCFDESYSEKYYRYDTVKRFVAEADCLLVIGTALETSFARSIVDNFLKRELPVIEVNLESAIKRGHNIQVIQKSEVALPLLFKEFYRLKKEARSVSPKLVNSKTGVKTTADAGKKKISPKASSFKVSAAAAVKSKSVMTKK